MFIEDKIIYKMVEFWYNMNEQRTGGVAFLSTKPKAPIFGAFFVSFGKNSRSIDRTIELFCCMLKEEYYRRGFGRFCCG